MLFYIKRFLTLEILVTVLLGGVGYWGILRSHLPLLLQVSRSAVLTGVAGSLWLTAWTFAVQYGYAVVRGRAYARHLTASLARVYIGGGAAQILFGGITAACGEELFFRGFIQQRFGIVAASVLFMLAHFGGREIRVVSLWSIFQGFYLGIFFAWTGNLLVPMIAHGLFDIGGMLYFRQFMAHLEQSA